MLPRVIFKVWRIFVIIPQRVNVLFEHSNQSTRGLLAVPDG
jgi:hypothetical protein